MIQTVFITQSDLVRQLDKLTQIIRKTQGTTHGDETPDTDLERQ